MNAAAAGRIVVEAGGRWKVEVRASEECRWMEGEKRHAPAGACPTRRPDEKFGWTMRAHAMDGLQAAAMLPADCRQQSRRDGATTMHLSALAPRFPNLHILSD